MSVDMTQTIRIAMWSGPRNMSTTMMRSFGARPEAVCVDEPFYAAWLAAAGEVHPMQEEILASQSSDPSVVARELLVSLPPGKTLQYQKQMTHHMLDSFPLDWVSGLRHAFLVRGVMSSVARVRRGACTVDHTYGVQQGCEGALPPSRPGGTSGRRRQHSGRRRRPRRWRRSGRR